MTDEELDEARATEARRIGWKLHECAGDCEVIAARLAREGWTPPDPVESFVELLWQGWLNTPSIDVDVKALIRECVNHGRIIERSGR